LIRADESGQPSHGTGMMSTYVDSFKAGAISPRNQPINTDATSVFHFVDAKYSLGHVTLLDAILEGANTTRQHGVALINVVRAHHIGRVGHYAEAAANAGLISIFWANVFGRPALVTPFGGAEARFGTNPHCIGIPRQTGDPLILDFATSKIALGKTRVAFTRGADVAEGCLLDSVGVATNDPSVMFVEPLGCLLPFGDHKGSGLAILSEVLSSVFAGGDTIADNREQGLIANNTFCILIDPLKLGNPTENYDGRLSRYLEWITAARRSGGVDAILLPGEPERRSRAVMGDFVHLSPQALFKLHDAAEAIGAMKVQY